MYNKAFYTAELREAPSTDGAIFPMGLGPAVAQVGAAEQGPAVELGQTECGAGASSGAGGAGGSGGAEASGAVAELEPAEQGPAVAQVGAAELGAVAELGPAADLGQAEQWPAVPQVGAAELGAVAELGPELGQAGPDQGPGPEQGPGPVSESREGPSHPSQQQTDSQLLLL